MLKRTILAAIAVSMLAVPAAQAQQRFDGPRNHEYRQGTTHQRYAPPRHEFRKEFRNKGPRHHHRWSKGHRVPEWQRRQVLRDYHRHGLKRPGRGQHWVKVDNEYLLISLATGIIAGIVAGR